MGYSSFRHFIAEQFPNIRFTKTEVGIPKTLSTELYDSKVSESKEPPQQQQQSPPAQIQLQQTTMAASMIQPTIFVDGSSNTTFTTPAGNTYVITQVLPTGFCQVPANFQAVSIADNHLAQATNFN